MIAFGVAAETINLHDSFRQLKTVRGPVCIVRRYINILNYLLSKRPRNV